MGEKNGSNPVHFHQTLWKVVTYGRKKFYNIGPWLRTTTPFEKPIKILPEFNRFPEATSELKRETDMSHDGIFHSSKQGPVYNSKT